MSILVIDDERSLRDSLCAYLEDIGHTPLDAGDGEEGLLVLREYAAHIDAVIVDLNMPRMDGYTFIRHAAEEYPDIPVIVLSGVGVVEDALKAVKLGAWDYITKPVMNLDIISHTLNKALLKARLIRENRAYQENLEELVRERTMQLELARKHAMQRLSRAAEYKDDETGRHVMRVGEIAAVLAKSLGLDEKHCDMLRESAPLHDLGKIGIPDHILLKPGKLTPEEWALMQQHTAYGCEILGPLSDRNDARTACASLEYIKGFSSDDPLEMARVIALLHHERWDGNGYPFGLGGEDIPIEARIVSVVDVYDALRSVRPYKKAFPEDKCLAIIQEGAGTQFDPDVVTAFFENLQTIKQINKKWEE